MDWPSDGPRLTALVEPVTPGVERRIVNDAFIALRSGTSESWGIAVIAGTGTVAVGRDPVGNEFRTIGEGRAFGDFGDEFDVSELAVRAVADQYTGRGPATMLSDMLCERLGEPSVESLLERLARYDPRFRAPELQNLTPMVLAATEGGRPGRPQRARGHRPGARRGRGRGRSPPEPVEPAGGGGARRWVVPDAQPLPARRAGVRRAAHGAAGRAAVARLARRWSARR